MIRFTAGTHLTTFLVVMVFNDWTWWLGLDSEILRELRDTHVLWGTKKDFEVEERLLSTKTDAWIACLRSQGS